MKFDFNKKKIVIGGTAVIAVLLAVGLFSSIGKDSKVPGVAESVISQETENLVTVPEIVTETTIARTKAEIMESQGTEAAEPETSATEIEPDSKLSETSKAADKNSSQKTKTPEQAVPPSEPPTSEKQTAPVENPGSNGECQPEQTKPETEQSKGGETDSNGAVYVPGFGQIENSGSVEGGTSDTDGDWNKQIGTME